MQKVSSGGGTEGGLPPENRCCLLNFLPLPGPSPGQSGFSFDQPQIYLLSLLGWKRLVEGPQSLAELVSILQVWMGREIRMFHNNRKRKLKWKTQDGRGTLLSEHRL